MSIGAGTTITIPMSKSDTVSSAGWISDKYWSNGSYDFTYNRRRFWRLCLERDDKPNVGYNAVVTKKGRRFVGIVWTDTATVGHDVHKLADAVKRRLLK